MFGETLKRKMLKMILFSGLVFSLNAKAEIIDDVFTTFNERIFSENINAGGYDWKVGDTTSYKMGMGFINGTMTMSVKELTSDLLTLSQELDLGMGGKKSCEMKIDPNTGETKSFVCDGQNQQLPGKDDVEVIDIKEDNVKVPAGTFNCMHVSMKQKKDGKIIDQWVNPKLVPVMGLIKMNAPGPMGKMTLELTTFKRMP